MGAMASAAQDDPDYPTPEDNSAFHRFEALALGMVRVLKRELDEEREKADRAADKSDT